MHGGAIAPRSLCKFLGRFGPLTVIKSVMTAASIGASRGGGYARYLEGKTVVPERGDYYLTPDGEMVQAPGRWLSDPETLGRLGIQAGEPVDGADFIALMEGRHPDSGRWLRPEGAGGGRGGGIDVTFSAPKSVSVVWALGDPWQRAQIEAAHARAVEQDTSYMRERVALVRRRRDGVVVEEHAKDLIAAEYRHTTARGVSGAQAPDPQLHSHIVITGVIREDDDRIVAVASRPVFRSAREVGAFYRSALAGELAREGYAVEQSTGKDGRYFEIAGVPRDLVQEFSKRSREVAHAAERFRARYGRAPERGELRNLALENRRSKQLTTRADLQRVWQETGARHRFGPGEALRLLAHEPPEVERAVEDRIEARLTEHHAVFDPGVLRAVALEQTAGEMSPDTALTVSREMVRDRRVIPLEGGRMTTLAVRAQEQAIERRAVTLAQPAERDVGDIARKSATREVAERIGAPLSHEQQQALRAITGPERLSILVGPAGTGKGVVIDTAARAEQLAGRNIVGIAVSGSTAERLGTDSPALAERTLTLDALVARANTGTIRVGPDTTIFLDEAGMVDHERLDALTELIERFGAKLIAIGDGKQLPSIGPGGMFDRLATHAPTAELEDIHRTLDPAEQKAWRALRCGEPEKAMAHYLHHGQLYFRDTRDDAGEAAVQRWHTLTQRHGIREVALIADSSKPGDRPPQRPCTAPTRTKRRTRTHEIQLPHQHYGLRQGDLIAFTTQHRPSGQPRVENGTRGEINAINERGVTITLDGSQRKIQLADEHLDSLRLAYAQHVYRQQGATVERSVIVTGGWQISKETAYVEASRARHGTAWYLAREELGADGQDERRVRQLAGMMRQSRAQTPSLAHRESPDRDGLPSRGFLPLDSLRQAMYGLARPLHRSAPKPEVSRERR